MEQPRLPGSVDQITARAEISRLRAAGYTAADTARSLNARGIPTPSGRGQWWPASVIRHGYPGERERWRAYIADRRARERLQRAARG